LFCSLSVWLTACLSVSLSVCISVFLAVSLSDCISVFLAVSLSVLLSVSLAFCYVFVYVLDYCQQIAVMMRLHPGMLLSGLVTVWH
jgi:type III secretory pathway component EscU